ncbi:MAG: putative LPS assembly protein LptD [Bacteroidales bacterium]|nr:putative LPS assembly protein LptD [Bacteroidales bacterium]
MVVLVLGVCMFLPFVFQQPVAGYAANSERSDTIVISDSFSVEKDRILLSPHPEVKEIETIVTDSSKVTETVELSPGVVPDLADTLALKADSLESAPKKGALDAPVVYHAKDSIVMTAGNRAFLFGESNVKYNDIELDAEQIEMNMDQSTVFATYGLDSLSNEFGYPLFKEGGGEYESKTMKYNFKTKKGYITDVITQQGEGYLTAGETKKLENDDLFMKGGRYTTCDNHDHPHFYMQLTKAKVRPKKNVVSGPAYLVVEDVPLPIALPFGFFPFNSKYSSGIIMPTIGDELSRGFYLRDGGYYFAISDYIDLALTGEIYTKGSWGLNARSGYNKRYKFNGNFDVGYLVTVTGDKGMPDYSVSKAFKILWSHSQDAKFDPYSTLSASVNISTNKYDRNNLNTMYGSAFTENTKSSSVNYTRRFPNNPFTISASMNVTQRSQDSSISVTLPDFTFTLNRIYPFQRKVVVGNQRWYEKIWMSYTGILQNRIETKDNLLFKSSLLKDWKNGMQHTVPVGATFTLFKYLNISPSFNYVERWYTNKETQSWDYQAQDVRRDTTYGFYRVYNYSASVSLSSKLYGFYKPLPFLGKKLNMIRHVFTPSVSFSYAPDFSAARYGFYDNYTSINANGTVNEVSYSPFAGQLFNAPGKGMNGLITMSVQNNIEAKVASSKDSTGFKIVSLIDNLQLGMSYNMAADSLNWSNLSATLRLKLLKNTAFSISGSFDPYTYRLNSDGKPYKANVPRWKAGKGFARLQTTSTSFSYTLDQNTLSKWFGKDKDKKSTGQTPTADQGADMNNTGEDGAEGGTPERGRIREAKKSDGEYDADGYYVNKIQWSLTANYSLSLAYGDFDVSKMEYKRRFTQSLDFSGSISPIKSWSFTFNSSYDFIAKGISYLSCSITKDIHCFQIEANLMPVGPYKSYNISIRATSSMLRDVMKYKKQSSYRDNLDWY